MATHLSFKNRKESESCTVQYRGLQFEPCRFSAGRHPPPPFVFPSYIHLTFIEPWYCTETQLPVLSKEEYFITSDSLFDFLQVNVFSESWKFVMYFLFSCKKRIKKVQGWWHTLAALMLWFRSFFFPLTKAVKAAPGHIRFGCFNKKDSAIHSTLNSHISPYFHAILCHLWCEKHVSEEVKVASCSFGHKIPVSLLPTVLTASVNNSGQQHRRLYHLTLLTVIPAAGSVCLGALDVHQCLSFWNSVCEVQSLPRCRSCAAICTMTLERHLEIMRMCSLSLITVLSVIVLSLNKEMQPNSTSGTQEPDRLCCRTIKTNIDSLLSVLSAERHRSQTTLHLWRRSLNRGCHS